MNRTGPIRKVLTAMLVMAILLWAEAGLALIPGDQVMACRSMMTAASDADTMSCCPGDTAHVPVLSANRPPCCSVSNDAERPLAFLVISGRNVPRTLDTAVQTIGGFVPQPAHHYGQLRNADAPRFVKPILELKTDLRI